MKPISSFIFILLLTFWPGETLANDVVNGTGINVIARACSRAHYKDFCVAVLSSAPGSKSADLYGVGLIALNLAKSNASRIYDEINKLLNSTSDPSIEQCLTDCAENYEDAIDQLDESLSALDSRGYNDVLTWVTAAMSDADSCEDGFKEEGTETSPLANENRLFSRLCSSILGVVNVMAGL